VLAKVSRSSMERLKIKGPVARMVNSSAARTDGMGNNWEISRPAQPRLATRVPTNRWGRRGRGRDIGASLRDYNRIDRLSRVEARKT
jgi:hypothetical protein